MRSAFKQGHSPHFGLGGPERTKQANKGSGGANPPEIFLILDAEISIYSYSNRLCSNNFDIIYLITIHYF